MLRASAEQLPFDDQVVDTVVTSRTLCTIPDPIGTLREMRRVLAPGGMLRFVEHGLAPEPGVARWQRALIPCWKHIGGGCHLDRKIVDLIHSAGFEILELSADYMSQPKLMTYMYEGHARRN